MCVYNTVICVCVYMFYLYSLAVLSPSFCARILADSRHENQSGRGLGALKRRVAPAGSRRITDSKRTRAQPLGSGAAFAPPCASLRPPTQSSSKLKRLAD